MDKIILAIETSCDETSVAIIKGRQLLSNAVYTQIKEHAKYGGVMPELASRLHAENITIVLDEALKKAKISLSDVDAFAFTRGPGLIGALHVGLQAAKTLALIYKKPLIPVHHLAGHIYANEFIKKIVYPALAVVVSGGNTELVYMKKEMDFKVIGRTKDDAVGECYDKVARVLGLPYPGGLPIDNLANQGLPTYSLPKPLHDKTYDFSYSGLKTSVINLVHHLNQINESINVPNMCASFQKTAIDMIVEKSLKAAKNYNVKEIILAGGVSANSYLRKEIIKGAKELNKEVIVPPLWCTGDNAAMIALVASYLYENGMNAPLNIGVDPNWQIEDYRKFTNNNK